MVMTISEIISELVKAVKENKNVNLNKYVSVLPWHSRLKTTISRKYGLSSQPRLIDIISAVPPQYKDVCFDLISLLFLASSSQTKS